MSTLNVNQTIPEPIETQLTDYSTPFKLAHFIKTIQKENSEYFEYFTENPEFLESKNNIDYYDTQSTTTTIKQINNDNNNNNNDNDIIDDDIKQDIDQNTTNIINNYRQIPKKPKNKNLRKFKKDKNKMHKKIIKQISIALFKGKWDGKMLYDNELFNINTYESILDCNNINKNNITSKIIWNIINYNQKKITDNLNNDEYKKHIKWYWFDHNNWIWRKYEIKICKWLSSKYKQFLKKNYKNLINSVCNPEKFNFNEILKGDKYLNNENIFIIQHNNDNNIIFKQQIKILNKENIFYREIRCENNLIKTPTNMIKNEFVQNPDPFIAPNELNDAF